MREKKEAERKRKDLISQLYSYSKLDDKSKSPLALYKVGEEKERKSAHPTAHLRPKQRRNLRSSTGLSNASVVSESRLSTTSFLLSINSSHFLNLGKNFSHSTQKFAESDIFNLSLGASIKLRT